MCCSVDLLGEDICDEQQAHCRLILVARQVQVFFHTVETGIADVDSVQEALETQRWVSFETCKRNVLHWKHRHISCIGFIFFLKKRHDLQKDTAASQAG
jgi:hypothetical protein